MRMGLSQGVIPSKKSFCGRTTDSTGRQKSAARCRNRSQRWLLKKARGEVLQVASPGLPFVIGARRFVENVLNVRFGERIVQALETCAHALRLHGTHAEPQQMHTLCECRRVGKHSVIVLIRIKLAIAQDEHPAGATEA